MIEGRIGVLPPDWAIIRGKPEAALLRFHGGREEVGKHSPEHRLKGFSGGADHEYGIRF